MSTDPSSPATNAPSGDQGTPMTVTPGGTKKKRLNKYSVEGLKAKKKLKMSPLVRYIRVHGNQHDSGFAQGYEGVLIYCEGYPGTVLVKPLYHREEPENQPFLKAIQPTGLVFCLQKDGKNIETYNEKAKKVLMTKVLARSPPLDDLVDGTQPPMTKAWCKNHFNEVLLPHLNMLSQFYDKCGPVWDENDSYREVDVWTDVISRADALFIMKDDHFDVIDKIVDYPTFFKKGKESIYSFFKIGEVPIDPIIRRFGIPDKLLHQKDLIRVNPPAPDAGGDNVVLPVEPAANQDASTDALAEKPPAIDDSATEKSATTKDASP